MNDVFMINESVDPRKAIEEIKSNCLPYLSQIKNLDGNRLRRGMKFNEDFKKINSVVDGRNEFKTDSEWENYADQWFLKKFGFNARSQSAYCAGGKAMASRYGLPYSVFPIGNFKFVWSPKIEDLYYPYKRAGGQITALRDALEQGSYVGTNLQNAVDSVNHEIMVYCPNGYYVVRDDVFEDWMWHYKAF